MKMIQTIDLTKRFGDFTANDHINLSVEKQEIKCIVGENGAGKSTLMNMLYGLLEPTEGKILIGGKEVKLKSPIAAIANADHTSKMNITLWISHFSKADKYKSNQYRQ